MSSEEPFFFSIYFQSGRHPTIICWGSNVDGIGKLNSLGICEVENNVHIWKLCPSMPVDEVEQVLYVNHFFHALQHYQLAGQYWLGQVKVDGRGGVGEHQLQQQ